MSIENPKKWYGKIAAGVAFQAVVTVLALKAMHGHNIADNITIFVSLVLFIAAIISLSITIFIPAEHAKATDIKVIQFNLWKPYIVWIRFAAMVYFMLCGAGAAFGMYWYAFSFLTIAVSLLIWPNYMKRVDGESKLWMVEKLKGEAK